MSANDYVLSGESYLCDGVYETVTIANGTRKNCEDMKRKFTGGEYRNLTIHQKDEDEDELYM